MNVYLVTGGAGFIGANFVKLLLTKYRDIKVVILDALTYAGNIKTVEDDIRDERCDFVHGDICNRELVKSLFEKHNFNFVVNFAAESHVDRSIDNPQLFLITNILGTQNLLDAARHAWTTGKDNDGYPQWLNGVRFHQVSTDEVYGSLESDNSFFEETTPIDPRSPYSASKASADMFVNAYAETYKMPVSITRCSNNYGPYHFPEKLIPLVIKNILEGKQLPVYGQGANIRDWLYVEDHCKAIDTVIHHGRRGEVYNIGGNNEMKNIDIVKLIIRTIRNIMEEKPACRATLKKKIYSDDGQLLIDWINDDLITFVQDRLGHDLRYAINPDKIYKELGWKPETSFNEGIQKTVQWFLDNQEWVEAVSEK
ncbi:MAG: dTDP-glucose 4,6-dehydratase [Tannerellaceae bacterium]|jgi:dTDP-glucose 4,6-dehydratase|nr:dTDP-glucose 4,6-dehydratase [Tannerellaceae bacterium]